MLFSRQFANSDYRSQFPYVDADYMSVIQENVKASYITQASVPLDSTTTSHIMHGRRKNLTMETLSKLSNGETEFLSNLLKTDEDRRIETRLQEDTE